MFGGVLGGVWVGIWEGFGGIPDVFWKVFWVVKMKEKYMKNSIDKIIYCFILLFFYQSLGLCFLR